MRLLVALLVMMAPLPALALSCSIPSIGRTYLMHDELDDRYVIVHGRLTFSASMMPKEQSDLSDPPGRSNVPARLIGKSIGTQGFGLPFEHNVTLEVSCLGPWCGSTQNGGDILAFVRKTDAGYFLALPPCGGAAFSNPTPAQLKQIEQCHAGGPCLDETAPPENLGKRDAVEGETK